jgi:hypothetical protein
VAAKTCGVTDVMCVAAGHACCPRCLPEMISIAAMLSTEHVFAHGQGPGDVAAPRQQQAHTAGRPQPRPSARLKVGERPLPVPAVSCTTTPSVPGTGCTLVRPCTLNFLFVVAAVTHDSKIPMIYWNPLL